MDPRLYTGQGRNRTIDTRIFNPTESPVRPEQAEDRAEISPSPTEPLLATELFPKRAPNGVPVTVAASELPLETRRPVGSEGVCLTLYLCEVRKIAWLRPT